MAQPGQLIVTNSGRNNVSVANLPGDGTIGTLANYSLPAVSGTVATPVLTVGRDLDGDTIPDLMVYTRNTETIEIYQGLDGGGYHLAPDMTLVLPAGTNTNVRSLAVADFNADGKLDLAAANFDNDTITVFLNTRTAVGALSFDGGTSFLCDANPTGLVATDLDGDNKVDLIVSCDTATTDLNADGVNDFRIEVFAGNGAGGFTAAPIRVRTGDASLLLRQPQTVVAGLLDPTSPLPQLVVGGPNGVLVIRNTSVPGTINLTPQASLITTTQSHHLGLGYLDAGDTLDIVATDSTPISMEILLNTGGLKFLPGVLFPVAAGGFRQPAVGDLNGDGRADIVEPNGAAAGAVTAMINTTVGGSIAAATNTPADIVITSIGHKLAVGTNYSVFISGALGNTNANGTHAITVIDADRFSLNTTPGNGAYTGQGMWALTGAITNANGAGGSIPIVITTTSTAGLATGDAVIISGNAFGAANGTFTITVASPTTFILNGVTTSGSGGGGTWTTTTKFIAPLGGNVGIASAAGGGAAVVITTASTATLTNGNVVTISGSPLAAANGTFAITVTGPSTFTLNGTNPAAAGTPPAGSGAAPPISATPS